MAKVRGWRGYSSYGKSALGVDFSVSGLDELLAKISAAGKSVDDAVDEAIKEVAPKMVAEIKKGAARHRKGAGKYGTDEVYDAVDAGKISRQGNYTFVQIGIDLKNHQEAKHAVFQAYGDGHSPEFPDPFIRPVCDQYRSSKYISQALRRALKKRGLPNG